MTNRTGVQGVTQDQQHSHTGSPGAIRHGELRAAFMNNKKTEVKYFITFTNTHNTEDPTAQESD